MNPETTNTEKSEIILAAESIAYPEEGIQSKEQAEAIMAELGNLYDEVTGKSLVDGEELLQLRAIIQEVSDWVNAFSTTDTLTDEEWKAMLDAEAEEEDDLELYGE